MTTTNYITKTDLDEAVENIHGYVDTAVDTLTKEMDTQFTDLRGHMDKRFEDVLQAIKDIRQDIKEHSHG